MWAMVKDDVIVTIYTRPTQVTVGDTNYPKNIFDLWSNDELATLNIYPASIANPDRPNPFYDDGGDDGGKWDKVTKTVTITKIWLAKDLQEVQAQLKNRIEGDAETKRYEIGSPISTKADEYKLALEEAKRFMSNPNDMGGFPLMGADIAAGVYSSVEEASADIIAKASNATLPLALIRKNRKLAARKIDTVLDVDSAWAEYQKIDWTT